MDSARAMEARWCGPGHNERRPPASFVRELKTYDDKLVVRWDNQKQRWQIACEDDRPNGPDGLMLQHLFMVVNDDGSYRELDGRVFERLHAMDKQRPHWYSQYLAERKALKAGERKELSDYSAGLSREVARYITTRPSDRRVV
jgi:hypothetical protein